MSIISKESIGKIRYFLPTQLTQLAWGYATLNGGPEYFLPRNIWTPGHIIWMLRRPDAQISRRPNAGTLGRPDARVSGRLGVRTPTPLIFNFCGRRGGGPRAGGSPKIASPRPSRGAGAPAVAAAKIAKKKTENKLLQVYPFVNVVTFQFKHVRVIWVNKHQGSLARITNHLR